MINPTQWVDPYGLTAQKESPTRQAEAVANPASQKSPSMKEVQAMPKGSRPNPSTYLPEADIDSHLQQFDSGASRFMTKSNLDKYGPGQRDGTSFVMPRSEADALMSQAKGDPGALADSIGLPREMLEGNKLMRVDFDNPKELGLRMPSGNEAGANDKWLAGGKLPDGSSEAVIDVGKIPSSRYSSKDVEN